MKRIIDSLDNFFSPKYWWEFYEPLNWTERKLVKVKRMTSRQALDYSRKTSLLYSFSS